MHSSHRLLALLFLGFVGCGSSGSGGGVGIDGGATGGIGNTGATGGSTGGVSGNGGTPTGGAGGLTGGAGGVGGVAGASGGTGGTAGASGECQTASECPGSDTECATRTCVNQTCGVAPTTAGFVVAAQTAGDCLEQVCDGQGQVVGQADDADVENDNNDCTTDSCASGSPTHAPKSPGASCTGSGGAKVCNAAQVCVQCVASADCTSGVCTAGFTCAQASCTDLTKNGAESDIDCGGATCPKCQAGQSCNVGTDCATNTCTGGTCACNFVANSLILSEVKWRGAASAQDDFVELYNPGNAPVTLTSAWTIEVRSEAAASYTIRFTGAGQVVPPHEHFLIVGSAPSFTGDGSLSTGIADEASVVLKNGASVVDAVCWNCGTNSFTDQVCQGAPVTVTSCGSATDRSIERKPGGTLGNCSDTNSPDDWQLITPSLPQNLSSPPTP